MALNFTVRRGNSNFYDVEKLQNIDLPLKVDDLAENKLQWMIFVLKIYMSNFRVTSW